MAEKVADAAPGATVTLPGTVTAALLLESVTAVFPEAAVLSVTVQFEVAPLATVAGVQLSEVTCTDPLTVTVVCADPL